MSLNKKVNYGELTVGDKIDAAVDAARAADVIERDGWCQGEYHRYDRTYDTNGREVGKTIVGHCLVGGIVTAVGDRTQQGVTDTDVTHSFDDWFNASPVWVAMAHHLGLFPPGREEDAEGLVVNWNDESGRTQEGVVAALREVAGKLTAEVSTQADMGLAAGETP